MEETEVTVEIPVAPTEVVETVEAPVETTEPTVIAE